MSQVTVHLRSEIPGWPFKESFSYTSETGTNVHLGPLGVTIEHLTAEGRMADILVPWSNVLGVRRTYTGRATSA